MGDIIGIDCDNQQIHDGATVEIAVGAMAGTQGKAKRAYNDKIMIDLSDGQGKIEDPSRVRLISNPPEMHYQCHQKQL